MGSFQPLTTATITASASGPSAPAANSSGAGGNIAPDAGAGLRYASIAFTNRNGNLSPTVTAFTSVSVDVPGDQLYMANHPHWSSQYHQPDHRIYGGRRHQRGSILLHSVSDGQRRISP